MARERPGEPSKLVPRAQVDHHLHLRLPHHLGHLRILGALLSHSSHRYRLQRLERGGNSYYLSVPLWLHPRSYPLGAHLRDLRPATRLHRHHAGFRPL